MTPFDLNKWAIEQAIIKFAGEAGLATGHMIATEARQLKAAYKQLAEEDNE